jgi:hypothetical protein
MEFIGEKLFHDKRRNLIVEEKTLIPFYWN